MQRVLPFLIAFLLFVMARSLAMMVLVSDQELIGTSDLVIVGTVLEDATVTNEFGWPLGRAVVRVDRVLKGQAAGNIILHHTVPPAPQPDVIVSDHGGFTLAPQTQWLFFMQRYQTGYLIIGGTQGRRQLADDEEKFAAASKAFPLRLTLAAPAIPIVFGQQVPVAITITNTGDAPVTCYQPMLEGIFYSPRFGPYLSFRSVLDPPNVAGRVAMSPQFLPVTVNPKSEKTVTVKFVTGRPQSWQVFTPDTYLLTPVFVRARLLVAVPASPELNTPKQNFTVASPWVDALVGFPPPPGP
ncbi:MAG: hypothetical protein ACYDCO_19355 [Armatimonadota bacterium]